MKYAVQLLFDNKTQGRLNKIREHLSKNGVHDEAVSINHISITDIELENPNELIEIVKNFATKNKCFDVTLVSAGSFLTDENVLFLSPITTSTLEEKHRDFLLMLKSLRKFAGQYYEVDKWFPHCTLAIRLKDSELVKGFKLLKSIKPLPIIATINKIDILQYDPKPYKEIAVFDLQ